MRAVNKVKSSLENVPVCLLIVPAVLRPPASTLLHLI